MLSHMIESPTFFFRTFCLRRLLPGGKTLGTDPSPLPVIGTDAVPVDRDGPTSAPSMDAAPARETASGFIPAPKAAVEELPGTDPPRAGAGELPRISAGALLPDRSPIRSGLPARLPCELGDGTPAMGT
jgi:hypothetical protein